MPSEALAEEGLRHALCVSAGKSPCTSKYAPWKLVTYIAFSNEQKAETFERYQKSGSGHGFVKRRLG
jgi:putative endonuclease